MKNSIFFLIALLFCLTSCQKKQYAFFQKSPQTQYESATKKPTSEIAKVIEPSKTQEIEVSLPSNPAETFLASNSAPLSVEKLAPSKNILVSPKSLIKQKVTIKEKIQAFRQVNSLKRQLKPSSLNPKSADPDKLAKISLILGIAGLVLLFIPSIGILGFLSAIGAIIFGFVSLRNTNKRGMAITGIVLGFLLLFLFLLVAVFLAAAFSVF